MMKYREYQKYQRATSSYKPETLRLLSYVGPEAGNRITMVLNYKGVQNKIHRLCRCDKSFSYK